MAHTLTLITGDGTGPVSSAVVQQVLGVLSEKGVIAPISWDVVEKPDADAIAASLKKTGVGLRSRFGNAKPVGKTPFVIHLRKALGTDTIVRRVSNIPGLPARASKVDLVIIREASEDIYAGFEHQTSEGVFETVKVTTRAACERISTFAFEFARANGRKKVTTVHKSNILKKADGMFLKVSQEVAARYPDIQHEEVIVDALCMKLVRWPQSFDVLLCGNLFGDIVSDCAAGMAGGITVAGGVQQGNGISLFESPHPDVGNPYPLLRVTVGMLRQLGESAGADRLEAAMAAALTAGVYTPDLGGTASAEDVGAAIIAAL